jgi:hypothetical protein
LEGKVKEFLNDEYNKDLKFVGIVAAATIVVVGIGCTIAGIVIGKTN